MKQCQSCGEDFDADHPGSWECQYCMGFFCGGDSCLPEFGDYCSGECYGDAHEGEDAEKHIEGEEE